MIDIERFNSRSPYQIKPSDTDGFYEFITDFDVQYQVGFMYDDSIIHENAYQFIITNINNKVSPNDDKVRQTILIMVDEFFLDNKNTLLYICETGDGKQAMRNRLFHYWLSLYDRIAEYTCLSSSITDMDGVQNFATIILRNDNPKLTEIISEFTETIRLLSHKPNS